MFLLVHTDLEREFLLHKREDREGETMSGGLRRFGQNAMGWVRRLDLAAGCGGL